jgi:hypothetical protein
MYYNILISSRAATILAARTCAAGSEPLHLLQSRGQPILAVAAFQAALWNML